MFLAALLLLYVIVRLVGFYNSSLYYADMGIGDRRPEVLYGVGMPSQVRNGTGPWRPATRADLDRADGWAYSATTGGRVEVVFDETGRSARISCFQVDAQPFACPGLFRVDLGMDEISMTRRLGAPTYEQLAGESKVMTYSDIGAEFALKRYTVYRITAVTDRSGGLSRIWRFLHNLIP